MLGIHVMNTRGKTKAMLIQTGMGTDNGCACFQKKKKNSQLFDPV